MHTLDTGSNDSMYRFIARTFAGEIEAFFNSEESLQAWWKNSGFSALPFDRTSNWHILMRQGLRYLWNELGPAVKSDMTQYDIDVIVGHLHSLLDYNLFTQVMLNLQDMNLLRYRVVDAEAERKAIEARWEGKTSPMAPKAKMFKNASTEEETAFNRDLSALKAINAIRGFTPATSFRVSPKGSTPALVDSANLSSLGIGADHFLATPEGFEVMFFDMESLPIPVEVTDNGKFSSRGIRYLFESKSGGDILGSVLRSRLAVHSLYPLVNGPRIFIPRMYSVMLIANKELNPHLETLPGTCGFTVVAGTR